MTATAEAKPEMMETFIALRAVNIGTCIRSAGDFIPEYTDPGEISPRALDRLLRMRYIERRSVRTVEVDAWREKWERENAPTSEGSEAVEGESSKEVTPPAEDEPKEPPVVDEEPIEDLGPKEEQSKKKIVTRRRRGNT